MNYEEYEKLLEERNRLNEILYLSQTHVENQKKTNIKERLKVIQQKLDKVDKEYRCLDINQLDLLRHCQRCGKIIFEPWCSWCKNLNKENTNA